MPKQMSIKSTCRTQGAYDLDSITLYVGLLPLKSNWESGSMRLINFLGSFAKYCLNKNDIDVNKPFINLFAEKRTELNRRYRNLCDNCFDH